MLTLPPLTDGRILRRYQRFLADVELSDGRLVVAHVPNTGSMASCWSPGAAVQLTHHDDPRRKLAWTLERVATDDGWIGVHTGRPNQVLALAVAAGQISPLAGYAGLRREAIWRPSGAALSQAGRGSGGAPGGRLDLLLTDGPAPDALVEIKNVTLLDGDTLRFPDAVSARGRRHLALLTAAVAAGRRGVMLFALNRPEGRRMAAAHAIDPAYGRALAAAAAAGVEMLAVRLVHHPGGIAVGALVPVALGED